MAIKNASQKPKRYFGLHMVEGVAEYAEEGKEPFRLFIGEEALKRMDATFQGCPLYVKHVPEVDLSKIEEADGLVVKSFYNKADGKHWAEFLVMSDAGHDAIARGWVLSNAYHPTRMTEGDHLWHGVEYSREVEEAEYEHLALVPNPRYQESIVLSPEDFQAYNSKKESELARVANSNDQGDGSMKFTMFKKTKVENGADLEQTVVTLPKSKKDMAIADVLNAYDEVLNMQGYASGDHMVKVGEEEMSVNDLVKKHLDLKSSMEADGEKAENESDEDDKKENKSEDDEKKENEDESDEKKENEDEGKDEKKDKKENSADAKEKADAEKAKKKAAFDAIKNAGPKFENDEEAEIDLPSDKVARGKERYGSSK